MASVLQQIGGVILQNIITQTEEDFMEVLGFDVEYTDDEVALFIQQ